MLCVHALGAIQWANNGLISGLVQMYGFAPLLFTDINFAYVQYLNLSLVVSRTLATLNFSLNFSVLEICIFTYVAFFLPDFLVDGPLTPLTITSRFYLLNFTNLCIWQPGPF